MGDIPRRGRHDSSTRSTTGDKRSSAANSSSHPAQAYADEEKQAVPPLTPAGQSTDQYGIPLSTTTTTTSFTPQYPAASYANNGQDYNDGGQEDLTQADAGDYVSDEAQQGSADGVNGDNSGHEGRPAARDVDHAGRTESFVQEQSQTHENHFVDLQAPEKAKQKRVKKVKREIDEHDPSNLKPHRKHKHDRGRRHDQALGPGPSSAG